MSYDDQVRRLGANFRPDTRYQNFGPLIRSMEVHGFRGVRSITLTFESSVTAFPGLNGTGKSTRAQLATAAYRKAAGAAASRFYVADFFPVSAADPEPFTRGRNPAGVTTSRSTSLTEPSSAMNSTLEQAR